MEWDNKAGMVRGSWEHLMMILEDDGVGGEQDWDDEGRWEHLLKILKDDGVGGEQGWDGEGRWGHLVKILEDGGMGGEQGRDANITNGIIKMRVEGDVFLINSGKWRC